MNMFEMQERDRYFEKRNQMTQEQREKEDQDFSILQIMKKYGFKKDLGTWIKKRFSIFFSSF